MRKKVILVAVLIVAIVAIAGGIYFFGEGGTENVLTPEELPVVGNVNVSLPEEPAVFNKEENSSEDIIKFVFKDFAGACVYSLNQRNFVMTENSDEEKVACYLEWATKENCIPIAVTTSGNYMIFRTEQGEKIAVQTVRYQTQILIEAREPIAFDDLSEQEKNSLLELIEE